ncbi:MAG: TerC family protein [Hyphomicrobium sp.]|nr:TerC family protein [Hyphomicrobium sp.]
MGKPLWMWTVFIGLVLSLLILDLGVFHRKTHVIEIRESLLMSAFYIGIAVAFGAWVWSSLGAASGQAFFTGFVVEKTLAMDNIFVISLIFSYFAIPQIYQHRVLFWGILGVIVLRAIMIALGATLIAEFSWLLYVFAAFLILTGIKMLVMGEKEMNIADNPVLKFMRRHMRITDSLHGEKFFVTEPDAKTGKLVRAATPLFVALILIEVVDVIFAVDSVPAIFAITTDPYIVYTSNIFAILGLRALYFALSAILGQFHYLKPALALVLVFIGSKIFVADAMGWDKFPASASLAITLGLLAAGIVASLIFERRTNPRPLPAPPR